MASRESLVLNLIVKDEAKIIRRCLASCKPHVGAYCIVDTGSTDGTQQLIRDFMGDMPGEVVERPWRNFGHNRTEAFALTRRWGELALLMDADHVLESATLEAIKNGFDEYLVTITNGSMAYSLPRIVRTSKPIIFDGAAHEAIICPTESYLRLDPPLEGWLIREYGDSNRRASGHKFIDDIALLSKQLLERPGDHRTMFYLAQSYRDAGISALALEWYQRCVDVGGWDEQVWYSQYQVGNVLEGMGKWPEAAAAYLKAYNMRPSRAEPMYRLALHYRKACEYHTAYLYAKTAASIPRSRDHLFVEVEIYEWRALDEQAICGFWVGTAEAREAAQINDRLLSSEIVPHAERAHIEANQRHCLAKAAQA